MKENREKAWSLLTESEKQSIYLTTGQGLSGWQAGEILQVTHYKYLELKARSETFFKLFSDYFEIYKYLLNPTAKVLPAFRDYIYGCIEKRLPLPEAKIYAGEGRWSSKSVREKEILYSMKTLKESESKWDQDLYQLIIEFDRWNNFRILPVQIQSGSPFKRKSNRQAKAYFKYLKNIHPNTLLKISTQLTYRGKNNAWIALISDYNETGQPYDVIPIRNDKKNIKSMTINRIYMFKSQEDAIIFAALVLRHDMVFTSKDGLLFWKKYDAIIQKAYNHDSITHTSKITNFYDESFKDMYTAPKKPRK